jgi:hypothetical protein
MNKGLQIESYATHQCSWQSGAETMRSVGNDVGFIKNVFEVDKQVEILSDLI